MKADPSPHLANRQWMCSALAGEIHGPGRFPSWKDDLYTASHPLELIEGMEIDSDDFYKKRHIRKTTGEEILKEEPPSKRYGVGLLFPHEREDEFGPAVQADDQADLSEEIADTCSTLPADSTKDEREQAAKALQKSAKLVARLDEDEMDALGLARLRRPRSMGITFIADTSRGRLRVQVSGARYVGCDVLVRPKKEGGAAYSRRVWFRVPVVGSFEFDPASSEEVSSRALRVEHENLPKLAPLNLVIHVRTRAVDGIAAGLPGTARLVTVTIINQTNAGKRAKEEEILFQSRFEVVSLDERIDAFLPLPRPRVMGDLEEKSLALLYRNVHAFAMGHGCAGDWEAEEGSAFGIKVIAEPLPFHETPPVTPDLVYPEGHAKAGKRFSISMLPLARAEHGWIKPLLELAELYETWIKNQEKLISSLDMDHRKAGQAHVESAKQCAARIRKGIKLLEDDAVAAMAFHWTNEAILLQQIAGRFPLREISHPSGVMTWSNEFTSPSLDHQSATERSWRPFQIAFLLMSLPGLWDSQDPDRDIADLIWFPTGGGKTEAYLGATAFHLIARRLQDRDDCGTGVLMRYTLRLLTSQQFQRASGLICALECIRLREIDDQGEYALGSAKFRIGIWVGGSTTPNNHRQSIDAFNASQRKGPEEYQHVLLRCPWCGSEMGPKRNHRHQVNPRFVLHGLRSTGMGGSRRILLHCPDPRCYYHDELPVEVVDEGVYSTPPSLIIGTVDKFATLSWRHEGRSIFGINEQGRHATDPPGLIIQDELHLITGPLGSMVGLYEGIIEELCTRRSDLHGTVIRPKLIASTATTRASNSQIRDLYARERTAVFPPPGLDADDAFFATYDRYEEGANKGKIKPGRMYVGVLARGYGSGLTVNVRVFSALLAAARCIPENERDPWYTLLVFYNALRELGADLTLFGADIPERLANLRDRWTPGGERRFLNHVLELTGRLENSEIPEALKALERTFPVDKKAVDACLASSIIEVGVDVPRLSLMAVSGQPKNTAQYIQATGRVGRESPGLVVMTYNHHKARDLSHFEHFRDYHGRLYAQVEPASVTPFTVQLLERALHGAFLAWVRNKVPLSNLRDPRDFQPKGSVAQESLGEFAQSMRTRIGVLFRHDSAACHQALAVFERIFKRRLEEWNSVTVTGGSNLAVCWDNKDLSDTSGDMPLMRYYGEPCRVEWLPYTWPTPNSMRGVDAECPAVIVPPMSENERFAAVHAVP
jgi:hypothetical protein